MITIILADDHNIVRKGLLALLTLEPDLSIIGETCSGSETIKLVDCLKPNVLVLDLMLGDISGLEVARRLSTSSPQTRIIILSMHSNEAYVHEAFHAGAKAYVLKESPPEELVLAIHEALSGHTFLSASLRSIES